MMPPSLIDDDTMFSFTLRLMLRHADAADAFATFHTLRRHYDYAASDAADIDYFDVD